MEILFKIGSLSIYTHGTFISVAIIMGSFFIYFLSRQFSKNKTIVIDLLTFSLLTGIVGARLLYFILYHDQFSGWTEVFKVWEGGLVSWGGYIVGAACAYFIVRSYKENLIKWMDALSLSGLLAIGIGRIGCFVSGELAGKQYSGPLTIGGKYPTTLFEAVFCLIIFIAFYIFYKRNKMYDGFWWKISLFAYAFGRFLIDFTRQEKVLFIGMSISQLFGLIISLCLAIWIWIEYSKQGDRYAK